MTDKLTDGTAADDAWMAERLERTRKLRQVALMCGVGAVTLACRADEIEAKADRDDLAGRPDLYRHRERAAMLRMLAVMLADSESARDGLLDLAAAWGAPPQSYAARLCSERMHNRRDL